MNTFHTINGNKTIPEESSENLGYEEEEGLTVDEALELAKLMPLAKGAGSRTVSTSLRLRRQGFTESKRSTTENFAVLSIRRGSDDWQALLKPFVSDLVFRSVVKHRFQGEITFRPYTCQAAVLFVDLSSYSRITAAIAHRGAHAISSIVNAYLSKLLRIVQRYGGDVVKFAGDAVMIVWEGDEKREEKENDSELGINLLCAAKCAMDMQENAGSFPVEGTSLAFRIHCGLCTGTIESEIFVAPTHTNMQRLYHSLGGDALEDISELVDLARAGEIAISDTCMDYIGERGTYKDVGDLTCPAKILTSLHFDDFLLDHMDKHIETKVSERHLRRNQRVEEGFIHPSVLRLLSHGGLSPTQIAQMRNLCVLFIAMTSQGSSVNWLMEVQGVLDKNRCPIVQIIDDDKGVHIVAAVNLYESVPESSLLGIDVCRELVEKQVGCAIGVASGSTFCGVAGSSKLACRWDITGPPAVRAARLMQYALNQNIEVAIDQSVYQDPMASTQMGILDDSVMLKGSHSPVPVYTFWGSKLYAAFRVLETVHANVHNDTVRALTDHIMSNKHHSAALVTGVPLAGKKIVCQRAAGYSNLVPFLHVCDESAGLLQLARTVATWFHYAGSGDVKYLAGSVMSHIEKKHWSRAHDECIELVNLAVEEGLEACFLVDRIQFLDEFSISLIRECLRGKRKVLRGSSRLSHRSSSDLAESEHSSSDECTGKICFLCVHVSLYQWKTASQIVEDITRSLKGVEVPVFTVLETNRDELRQMFCEVADMEVEDRWLDTYAEASGFTAGYFIERAAAIRNLSGKLWSEGKRGLTETTEELCLNVPLGFVRKNKEIPVTQISADVSMRFSQIYDELPPLFQMITKVVMVANRKGCYKISRTILWQVLNDLIAEGVEAHVLDVVLDEFQEMFLLKIESENESEVVSFQSPALGDIANDVCTPIQLQSITTALIDRLEPISPFNFRIPLILADFYHSLGIDESKKKELWVRAHSAFLQESEDWSEYQRKKWKELIEDLIQEAGYDAKDILGDGFEVGFPSKPAVGNILPLLKIYSAPVSLGPMGHTLSVICRNTFHEFGVFHGYSDEKRKILSEATRSAADRYIKEMRAVERFLAEYGLAAPNDVIDAEGKMLDFIAGPAKVDQDVQNKAVMILDRFVPEFIETRLARLYELLKVIRERGQPSVITSAPAVLRLAYEALQRGPCRRAAAQDALMTLATYNWKPTPPPEYLPSRHHQSVATLRNKTLKRLNQAELIIFRHQQTIDDLEVCLITTMLLQSAQKQHYFI